MSVCAQLRSHPHCSTAHNCTNRHTSTPSKQYSVFSISAQFGLPLEGRPADDQLLKRRAVEEQGKLKLCALALGDSFAVGKGSRRAAAIAVVSRT